MIVNIKLEVVSPICEYNIEDIHRIARDLRNGNARRNKSCGIHIHIDASKHNARTHAISPTSCIQRKIRSIRHCRQMGQRESLLSEGR